MHYTTEFNIHQFSQYYSFSFSESNLIYHIIFICVSLVFSRASLMAQRVKKFACNVKDLGLIPRLGRSPERDIATHSSILAWRNPTDRGAWWAKVHRVAKSWTWLSYSAQQSPLTRDSFLSLPLFECHWQFWKIPEMYFIDVSQFGCFCY